MTASSTELRAELKALLVSALNLRGRDPASIDDDAPLFGAAAEGQAKGLGLDSLDALELAMAVEERFGVRLPEGEDARFVYRSVATLADYVAGAAMQGNGPGPPGPR